jgi:mono/diheme cytochrome c family protein
MPRYRSGEGALRRSCLPCHGPSVAAAPQPASPKPLGSQEPPALYQKVPLLVMPLVVRRAGTLEAAAHSEEPAD